MLDMSGKLENIEPEDVVEGDLIVVLSHNTKAEAGSTGRKLAQYLYKEIEIEQMGGELLIVKSEKLCQQNLFGGHQ